MKKETSLHVSTRGSKPADKRGVRTHSFGLGTYRIRLARRIDGICEIPGEDIGRLPELTILSGNSIQALNSALHEGLHAMGVPDASLHDKDGFERTEAVAKFLWRLGWRRTGEQ